MTAKTLSVIFKEKFSKMSDDMNDIKEVNNFYKEAIKDAIEEKKSVGKKKKPSPEKNENGEEKIKKPPTEYQEFVKNYQQVIKEKFPDLPSNQRFGKIAEEWKIFKENRDNNESQVKNKSVAVVNNFMKVEEVSPPSSDLQMVEPLPLPIKSCAWRNRSQLAARSMFGLVGCTLMSMMPVLSSM